MCYLETKQNETYCLVTYLAVAGLEAGCDHGQHLGVIGRVANVTDMMADITDMTDMMHMMDVTDMTDIVTLM